MLSLINVGGREMARGKAITTSQKVLIAKLHLEANTHQEIADELGISRISVVRFINHDEETKEMIYYLEQHFKSKIFNQSIELLKEGYKDVEIDGKTPFERIVEGYNNR